MFRFIGVVVVIGVLYFGYGAIQSWYAGESTPQEAVKEVRKSVGEALIGDKPSIGSGSATPMGPARPAPQPSTAVQQPPPPQDKPLDTDEVLRRLMKQ